MHPRSGDGDPCTHGGIGTAPTAMVPTDAWNAERLNAFLADIDAAIAIGQYERAVTLSYTCLEGFYGYSIEPKRRENQPPTNSLRCHAGFGTTCEAPLSSSLTRS
jgi:hypothetical protein